MKNSVFNSMAKVGVVGLLLLCAGAHAADYNLTGFIRQEAAFGLNDGENIFNQPGIAWNGETATNVVTGEQIVRPTQEADTDARFMVTRAELDIQINFNRNWSGQIRVRGLFDWTSNLEDDLDFGNPDYFGVPFFSSDAANRLEVNGDDWMIDLPSFYLDYTNGPLWLRIGNQQIAWGEALFFRVADVANGLDLRRHLILDWGGEEYADERIGSLGIRGSYQLNRNWEVEAFAQEFSPTIYGNENTSYNVIASQFVVHQKEGFEDAEGEINAGLKLTGQIGELGVQFFVVDRINPDGVFRWTKSNQDFCLAPDPVTGVCLLNLGDTPFEAFSGLGVYSSQEWFGAAANARLDGVDGVAAAARDFPAAGAAISNTLGLLGADTNGNGLVDARSEAAAVLDGFFSPTIGLGDLRGHITRDYHRETIYGAGFNYMVFADEGSLFDQLMIRMEASYTPDRKFTDISLGRKPIEENELIASLVLEKWQRWSDTFPSIFMIFEYMYKSESDMFGRHLSGMDNDGVPNGNDDFHAVVFALQQPFPNLTWRFDLAVLHDLEGGTLIQPGIRWRPQEGIIVELFANIMTSDGDNDDVMETLDWADEIAFRVAYQF